MSSPRHHSLGHRGRSPTEVVLKVVRRRGDERGQSMVEYALIISLIVIILIAIVFTIGHQTHTMYSNIQHAIPA